MDYLATGFYCLECGFFEEIDLDEGERCPGCGCDESNHLPVGIVEVKNK